MSVVATYHLKHSCGHARPFCRPCTNSFKVTTCGPVDCDAEPPSVICLKPKLDTSILCSTLCPNGPVGMLVTLTPPENSVVNRGDVLGFEFPSNPNPYLLLPQRVGVGAKVCIWSFEEYYDTGFDGYAPFLYTCGQRILAREWGRRAIQINLRFDNGVLGTHWEYSAEIEYYYRAITANELCDIQVGDFLGRVNNGAYLSENVSNVKMFESGDCDDGFSFSFRSLGFSDLTVLVNPVELPE